MNMTEERKKTKGVGRAHWLTMASLALNLFLVGVLVGPLFGPDRDQERLMRRSPREPGLMLDRITRELPEPDAAKVRAIFEDTQKNRRDRHVNMHETSQKLAAILRQEKPDMESLRKTMAEVHQLGQGLHVEMNRAFERVATEVSFEGRQKIADAMEKGLFKGGPMPPPPMPPEGDRPPPDNDTRPKP